VKRIRSRHRAIHLLFDELGDSLPKAPMTRSYVLFAAGLCLSQTWGRMYGSDCNLTALMAEPRGPDVPINAGVKLKSFVDGCVVAGLSDTRTSLSPSDLIDLMVRALDTDDFEICVRNGRRFLCSSPRLELRRGLQVRVNLDARPATSDWSQPVEWWD
jgi:hypothetical protein